jgi:hypothetical protein
VISSSADRGKMFAIWKEQLRCPWSLDHAEMQGPNFQKKKDAKLSCHSGAFMPFCQSANAQPNRHQESSSRWDPVEKNNRKRNTRELLMSFEDI